MLLYNNNKTEITTYNRSSLKRILLPTLLLLLFLPSLQAQVKIDVEVRPRFEFRNGFKTLFPDNTDPAAFVSQRTRFNAGYKVEDLDLYVSFQNVRVWGDVPQLNSSDRNGIAIHQAWAKFKISDNLSLKAGRQEIIYDDSRFFGNVGWAQQARSHDVAMFKYGKNKFKTDVGFAFNQDGESLTGTVLTTNTYKAFQYLWMHKDWNSFSGSLLFLNNGLQYIDTADVNNNETRYSQNLGTHLKYKKNKLSVTGNAYYQLGQDRADNDLSAYLFGIDVQYKVADRTKIGLGGEMQSGNDNGTIINKNNEAFNPLYGTNHKFNGLMDYFYVGNHINNVGLIDLYVSAKFIIKEKSTLDMAVHNFSSAADFSEKQFGNEVDLVYSLNVQKYVTIKAGYSQLFAAEGLEILKGNSDQNSNNWAWLMLVVKPTLFEKENK
ncbi:MAG: hypothetical protein ACI9J3_000190 [Parvicellaceae bacterium]|jgi:hypothetical protein